MLEAVLFGNTVMQYIEALAIAVGTFVAAKVVYFLMKNVIGVLVAQTRSTFDDAMLDKAEEPLVALVAVIGLYFGITRLALDGARVWVDQGAYFLTAVILTWLGIRAIDVFAKHWLLPMAKKTRPQIDDRFVPIIDTLLKFVLVVFSSIMVLSHFGYNVNALVAGLGVGGVAIAFALQNILADIFASFSILFDKPFKEGDFIVIDGDSGTVRKIGIKSTRLKALTGEEVVISNKELTESRVHNFKKMKDRRVAFEFGVVYGTKTEKINKIPGMVKKIINAISLAKADRVHFKKFGNSALVFEVVYYIDDNDYAKYMGIQEKINVGIKKAFEREKIEMAFPTQTVYVKK